MSGLFTKMIKHLRQSEEVVLYAFLPVLQPADEAEVLFFLETDYAEESVEYPFEAPDFDREAASWAARVVFHAAQLLLYREQQVVEIAPLFAAYSGKMSPGAVLSADLMLRFLPDILLKIKAIDQQDPVAGWLEDILRQWHYSGVRYHREIPETGLDWVTGDSCVYQMYINRIITYQNLHLARMPVFQEGVRASLGTYGSAFWKNFYNEIQLSHEPER